MTELRLMLAIVSGIALLLVLIIRVRLNAFLSLLISSIWIGLWSGISPDEMADTISKGMGDTLAFVATIVGLGAIFGAILEHSGGARQLSQFLVRKTGEKKARLAMLMSGFVVAIPVFFDVAFIILFPVIQALARRVRKPLLFFALPLLTGIALTHSFIPPTLGPVAVADILKVDLGWMILLGAIIGLPTALVCGTLVAKRLSFHAVEEWGSSGTPDPESQSNLVFLTNTAILIPLLLMVMGAVLKMMVADQILAGSMLVNFLIFAGHPFTALILATLFAIYFLGRKAQLDRSQLFEISNKSLAPAGTIILITGAGGVLKQTLITTGIGNLIAEHIADSSFSILFLAYLTAGVVRILQGSATIAMITGAGIVGPVVTLFPEFTMIDKTFIALSVASGSTMGSHVNDSAFWLINRYLQQTVTETLRSWTVLSFAISLLSFVIILIVSSVL